MMAAGFGIGAAIVSLAILVAEATPAQRTAMVLGLVCAMAVMAVLDIIEVF